MTRGPPPLKAIAKAKAIAIQQGPIMNNPALARSRYGFVIFRRDRITFVRIKRIRAHVCEPDEILLLFRTDVIQLRMLPKTPVISREIWTLSPWNAWQFFVIEDDQITEIRYEVPPELLPAETISTGISAQKPLPATRCATEPSPTGPEPGAEVTVGSIPGPVGGGAGITSSPMVGESRDEGQGPKPA